LLKLSRTEGVAQEAPTSPRSRRGTIATAPVPTGRDLHAGPASTVWLVAVLYLAAAVGRPTMGREPA
jgi:hypothetical protein